MDYKKAIEVLLNEIGCVDLDANNRGYIDESEQKFMDACNTAVSAMEELQQLHDQGFSLDRMKDIDFRKEIVKSINYDAYVSMQGELEEYREIGTLEELRAAAEKQRRKKPLATNRCYVCPHCGLVTSIKIKHNYCDACGQHIDWSEKE